jgi:hypothetical protein
MHNTSPITTSSLGSGPIHNDIDNYYDNRYGNASQTPNVDAEIHFTSDYPKKIENNNGAIFEKKIIPKPFQKTFLRNNPTEKNPQNTPQVRHNIGHDEAHGGNIDEPNHTYQYYQNFQQNNSSPHNNHHNSGVQDVYDDNNVRVTQYDGYVPQLRSSDDENRFINQNSFEQNNNYENIHLTQYDLDQDVLSSPGSINDEYYDKHNVFSHNILSYNNNNQNQNNNSNFDPNFQPYFFSPNINSGSSTGPQFNATIPHLQPPPHYYSTQNGQLNSPKKE